MGENTIIISLILFNIFFLAFIAGIIIFIREYRIKKKAHVKEIHTIDETHKRELLETQVEIQTQTMQYIGQEIHDNIGQKLTLASLYTQQLAFENKAPQVNKNIENIGDIINESLTELRQLSKSLTDNTIETLTISELIVRECKKINAIKQCDAHFSNNTKVNIKSYQIKSIVFRITQEFLQNSIKHAHCKNIFVSLENTDKTIQLVLKDDGKGFNMDTLHANGIGLKNMKKRTELIGGTFKLESENLKGTKLTIDIPHK
ncbi:sensor histidine kinase [Lacinutrix sp. Hel_I_90]|uniref:sensor histidine kinase n=1 Tax=Lacinutrix sp. Hel_I_90 TaxID=1249999 RepID=UPI0005CAD57E|nr:ATP-binding protein [Lacinutrix sp. Hel_I_90]